MSVEELEGVRDTRCDSSKSANGILCFHCNGFTACDALSVPLLLSHDVIAIKGLTLVRHSSF